MSVTRWLCVNKEGSANKVHGTLINNLIGHFVLDNYTVIIREYGIWL